nr:cytochrome C oxidase subunit IV family protein [Shimazuella alba]
MIAFTAAAFYIVVSDVVPSGWVIPLLLVFAAIQVFLQLFTFMHLDQKGTAFYTFFMIAGIFIAVISAVGILLM